MECHRGFDSLLLALRAMTFSLTRWAGISFDEAEQHETAYMQMRTQHMPNNRPMMSHFVLLRSFIFACWTMSHKAGRTYFTIASENMDTGDIRLVFYGSIWPLRSLFNNLGIEGMQSTNGYMRFTRPVNLSNAVDISFIGEIMPSLGSANQGELGRSRPVMH